MKRSQHLQNFCAKLTKYVNPAEKRLAAKITNPERGVEVCSCHCRQVGRWSGWEVGTKMLACGAFPGCHFFEPKLHVGPDRQAAWRRAIDFRCLLPQFMSPALFVCLIIYLFVCLFVCFFVWLSGCLYQQTEILKRNLGRQNILFLLVIGAQEILRNWAYWLTLGLISEAVPGVLQAWKVIFLLHRILVTS